VYNNLVVIAQRGKFWGYSEIQQTAPTITAVEMVGDGSFARVTYAYPPFSNANNVLKEPCNDAEMNLVVELGPGAHVRTQLFSRNDVQQAAVHGDKRDLLQT
jgi:hypothetical protein